MRLAKRRNKRETASNGFRNFYVGIPILGRRGLRKDQHSKIWNC